MAWWAVCAGAERFPVAGADDADACDACPAMRYALPISILASFIIARNASLRAFAASAVVAVAGVAGVGDLGQRLALAIAAGAGG